MIEKHKLCAYDYDIVRLVADVRKNTYNGESKNAVEVIQSLMENKDIVVYIYEKHNDKIKWYHRLNRLWVYPLALSIIPFQWLFTGKVGVNRNSSIGKIINKLANFT